MVSMRQYKSTRTAWLITFVLAFKLFFKGTCKAFCLGGVARFPFSLPKVGFVCDRSGIESVLSPTYNKIIQRELHFLAMAGKCHTDHGDPSSSPPLSSSVRASSVRLSARQINPSIPNAIVSIDQVIENAKDAKVIQLVATNTRSNPRHIVINGRSSDEMVVNFGSCSYLGLETHDDIVKASSVAAQLFGSQFSSSQAYLSHELNEELESLLSEIYHNKPVMVAPTTTLAHIAALPVLVGDDDAVIVDMQVHSSVQTAAQLLKARGIPLTVIRHNDMESLENTIKKLRSDAKTRNIWYLADGVYSMYGDYADFTSLKELLGKYNNFHVYIDDAHGVGWTGKNGCGIARTHMGHPDRMILAVSLSKSFAVGGGGAIVFATEDQRTLVQNCGGPMIFSTPMQPTLLGAACASMKIHLSKEINERHARLEELTRYCDENMAALGLPQYSRNLSPVFFIPVGKPEAVVDLVQRLLNDGFFVNSAIFPAVPMRKGGLRIIVAYHLTEKDIDNLLASLRKHYGSCLQDHGITKSYITKNFKIPQSLLTNLFGDKPSIPDETSREHELTVEVHNSIQHLNRVEWDNLFFGEGNIDSKSMAMYEKVFDGSTGLREDKWDFYYFIARDTNTNDIVAATYFTTVLLKDDMLSSARVSEKAEKLRTDRDDPYFLCSKTVMIGSPISGGNHLHLARSSAAWKEAVRLLTKEMERVQENSKSSQIMFRSLTSSSSDSVLEEVLLSNGFSRMKFMDQYVIPNIDWDSPEDMIMSERISYKKRKELRKRVLNHLDDFRVESTKPKTADEIRQIYSLYLLVHNRSRDLNTFPVPMKHFEDMVHCQHYDMLRVYKKGSDTPVAMVCSSFQGSNYGTELIGFERNDGGNQDVNIYLLGVYYAISRAQELGCKRIDLGFTAGVAKRKFGADRIEQNMYVQVADELNQKRLLAI